MDIHWGGTLDQSWLGRMRKKERRLNDTSVYGSVFNYSSSDEGSSSPERRYWAELLIRNRTLTSASAAGYYVSNQSSSLSFPDRGFMKKSRLLSDQLVDRGGGGDRSRFPTSSTAVVLIAGVFFCITLAVTISLAIFCRKRNSVFAFQKSEQEDYEEDEREEADEEEEEEEELGTDVETETDLDLELGGSKRRRRSSSCASRTSSCGRRTGSAFSSVDFTSSNVTLHSLAPQVPHRSFEEFETRLPPFQTRRTDEQRLPPFEQKLEAPTSRRNRAFVSSSPVARSSRRRRQAARTWRAMTTTARDDVESRRCRRQADANLCNIGCIDERGAAARDYDPVTNVDGVHGTRRDGVSFRSHRPSHLPIKTSNTRASVTSSSRTPTRTSGSVSPSKKCADTTTNTSIDKHFDLHVDLHPILSSPKKGQYMFCTTANNDKLPQECTDYDCDYDDDNDDDNDNGNDNDDYADDDWELSTELLSPTSLQELSLGRIPPKRSQSLVDDVYRYAAIGRSEMRVCCSRSQPQTPMSEDLRMRPPLANPATAAAATSGRTRGAGRQEQSQQSLSYIVSESRIERFRRSTATLLGANSSWSSDISLLPRASAVHDDVIGHMFDDKTPENESSH